MLSLNQQLIDVWIKSLGRLKFNVIKVDVVPKANTPRETKKFFEWYHVTAILSLSFFTEAHYKYVRGNQFNFIAKNTPKKINF